LHRLFWVCDQSGRKFPAGVAFYNEGKGDYRLCVDAFCESKAFFLRPVSMADEMITFRVESAVRKAEGGLHKRREIGSGRANAENPFPVVMEIGPYDRVLVLEAAV
jgi:hypothetical protein